VMQPKVAFSLLPQHVMTVNGHYVPCTAVQTSNNAKF